MPAQDLEKGTDFYNRVKETTGAPLRAGGVKVLQLNITRKCNLACRHCHVGAGPGGAEMPAAILGGCLEAAVKHPEITTMDITGGAPEMHPALEGFLDMASKLGRRLIVRSNLTILLEPAYAGFVEIYARNKVELAGSLPSFSAEAGDRQRGASSFARAVSALKLLNARGYGRAGSGLTLNLAHNPAGAFLPGPQGALEQEYRRRLAAGWGVEFNSLYCIANMPVGRYLDYLRESGNLDDYMAELEGAYNPEAARKAMCRSMVSVGPDGALYDCDFNQALRLPVRGGGNISAFDPARLAGREIAVRNHCYGCAAGRGSGCQGASAGV